MRFKATLAEAYTLQHVFTAFHALHNTCQVTISKESVAICLPASAAERTTTTLAFAYLPTNRIFESCRVESKSDDNIPFLVSTANMLNALRSIQPYHTIVFKLTKRFNTPFLLIEGQTEMELLNRRLTVIEQLLPIKLLTMADAVENREPELDPPAIKFKLPVLRKLAAVVEKLAPICDEAVLTASEKGHFRITAMSHVRAAIHVDMDSPAAREFSTQVAAAEVPSTAAVAPPPAATRVREDQNKQHQQQDKLIGTNTTPTTTTTTTTTTTAAVTTAPVPTATGRLSLAMLKKVLAVRHLNASNIVGCIVNEGGFIIFVKLCDFRGTMTCYLPLIGADEELEDNKNNDDDMSSMTSHF